MTDIGLVVDGVVYVISDGYIVGGVVAAGAAYYTIVKKNALSLAKGIYKLASVAANNLTVDELNEFITAVRALQATCTAENRKPTVEELGDLGEMFYTMVKS
jgi:hypothetical protein